MKTKAQYNLGFISVALVISSIGIDIILRTNTFAGLLEHNDIAKNCPNGAKRSREGMCQNACCTTFPYQ